MAAKGARPESPKPERQARPKPATNAEIEAWTGIDVREIQRHRANGAIPARAPLQEVIRSLIGHYQRTAAGHQSGDGQHDLVRSRARLAEAQREAVELRNAELRGDLIRRRDAVLMMQAQIGNARARFLGLHAKVKQQHPQIQLVAVATIERLVREALSELARDGLPDDLRSDLARSGSAVAAAGAADGERMG